MIFKAKEFYNNGKFKIYREEENYCYCFSDGDNILYFMPYAIAGSKCNDDGEQIYFDINDLKEILSTQATKEEIEEIENILIKSKDEDVDTVWKFIKYIQGLDLDKSTENKKEKKKKKQRKIKVALSSCCDMDKFKNDEDIDYNGFYEQVIDGQHYIVDYVKAHSGRVYVKFTNITEGYVEVDFDEMKNKYSMPSLFDFLDF